MQESKMRIFIVILISMMLTGCMTSVSVESTKQWEGHYMTIEEFHKKTNDIELDKNESIWVLSNHTLNRLLKNTGK